MKSLQCGNHNSQHHHHATNSWHKRNALFAADEDAIALCYVCIPPAYVRFSIIITINIDFGYSLSLKIVNCREWGNMSYVLYALYIVAMTIRDRVPCSVAAIVRETADMYGSGSNPWFRNRCRRSSMLWSFRLLNWRLSRGVWTKTLEWN